MRNKIKHSWPSSLGIVINPDKHIKHIFSSIYIKYTQKYSTVFMCIAPTHSSSSLKTPEAATPVDEVSCQRASDAPMCLYCVLLTTDGTLEEAKCRRWGETENIQSITSRRHASTYNTNTSSGSHMHVLHVESACCIQSNNLVGLNIKASYYIIDFPSSHLEQNPVNYVNECKLTLVFNNIPGYIFISDPLNILVGGWATESMCGKKKKGCFGHVKIQGTKLWVHVICLDLSRLQSQETECERSKFSSRVCRMEAEAGSYRDSGFASVIVSRGRLCSS